MYVARRDHRAPGCGSSSLVVWPELAIILLITSHCAATLTLVLLLMLGITQSIFHCKNCSPLKLDAVLVQQTFASQIATLDYLILR